MKQAKIGLTMLAILTVIGGTLAFKANRIAKFFYMYTTSMINGRATGVCSPEMTTIRLSTTINAPNGVQITLSAAPAWNVFTCTAYVIPAL